jgi:hypothetical protein
MTTVKQVIEDAYTKVNGEYEPIIESSDDFKTYLNVLNQIRRALAHTSFVKWQMFFDMEFDLPDPVANGVLSYTIPNASGITVANSPYDHIFFVDGTGAVVAKYKLVSIAVFQSTSNTQVCAIAAGKFYLKATEAKIVGTTIRIPAYVDPTPYTSATEEVIVDSIPYVVTAMAAFICSSSPVPFIARNAKDYAAEAKDFLKEMRENNKVTQNLIIKRLNSNVTHTWDDVMNVMTLKDL